MITLAGIVSTSSNELENFINNLNKLFKELNEEVIALEEKPGANLEASYQARQLYIALARITSSLYNKKTGNKPQEDHLYYGSTGERSNFEFKFYGDSDITKSDLNDLKNKITEGADMLLWGVNELDLNRVKSLLNKIFTEINEFLEGKIEWRCKLYKSPAVVVKDLTGTFKDRLNDIVSPEGSKDDKNISEDDQEPNGPENKM